MQGSPWYALLFVKLTNDKALSQFLLHLSQICCRYTYHHVMEEQLPGLTQLLVQYHVKEIMDEVTCGQEQRNGQRSISGLNCAIHYIN